MLSRCLTFLAAAAMALSATAGSLVWLETEHQFGAFNEDLNHVRCTFRAVNVDTVPVSVLSARANCGCTVPSYPKTAIAPGDTLRIDVEYNAVGRPGRFFKKVFIDTSDGEKATLNVRGTVVAAQNTLDSRYPIEVGKARLNRKIIALGSTVKGKLLYGGLYIYNSTDHPIQPRIEGFPPYVKGYVNPPVIPVGESGFLTMTAATDKIDGWGTISDSFKLTPDRDLPADSAIIDIAMILNEDFSTLTPKQLADAPEARLSEQTVDFDRIRGKEPLTRTFTITNTGKSTLLVRNVATAEKALTVNLSSSSIKPGKEATVTVTLNPAQLPADTPLNARINLMFNVPGAPHANVRVVGTR